MKIRSILKLTILPFLLFAFNNCSSVKEVQSLPNNNEVIIDGLKNDWEGKLSFDSKAKIAVGFKNDGENLYICVTTNDRTNMMKILRLGMTIWLEPESGNKKIGIKYPIVDMERMRDLPFGQENLSNENPEERFSKLIANQKKLSIVNEDDYPLFLLSSNDENNFYAKLGLTRESFVYELKVPLSTNSRAKYFIEAKPSEKISIGIETNEFKLEAPGGRSGVGMQPGGGRPSGGGSRSGRMPGGGRNQEMNFEQIKLLFDVKLAGG
ncbi:MAG: hypothetical protein RDU14_05295 [Melioribacteraceae bacterium]|nr:hypothetical protein [Melioribacteraceae bacterium]